MNQSSEPIRVLQVDDEPQLAEVTAELLEREDDRFAVETATDAGEGLERLDEGTFDCVVSDFDMPGTNGIGFLEAVRENDSDLPFILYTGKGSEEIASDAISAGVTDYLQKGSGNERYQLLANRIENAVTQYRAERRFERTQRLLRELTDASMEILWMFSPDWDELLFLNETSDAPTYEEVYGRPVEELETNPRAFMNAIHPADRELVRDAMARVSGGESIDIEYRVNEAEGYGRWVWVQAEPVFDDEGCVSRVAGFVRDITDRKKRERELQQVTEEYEAVFDTVTDGLALIDVDRDGSGIEFELRQINSAHEAVTGVSSAEIRGKPPREAIGEDTWGKIAHHYRRCVESERPVSYEETLDLPAGTVHWQTELVPVVTEGEVTQIVGVARDITDRGDHVPSDAE
jgi:PAS domain S-box-containing protein